MTEPNLVKKNIIELNFFEKMKKNSTDKLSHFQNDLPTLEKFILGTSWCGTYFRKNL